ncbi:hypothetical protein VZO05_11030 [Aggregatilineales bacterium SYSU G02658]
MRLLEQTPTRLTLGQNRPVLAAAMLAMLALSVLMLVNLLVQTAQRADVFTGAQWVGLVIWAGLALGLIGFSVWTLNVGLRGTRLTFDRDAQTVTLRRPFRLGLREQRFAIYAVSGLELIHNAEFKVYALVLLLRSGERLPLVTVSPYAEADVRRLVKRVREFLNQPYRPVHEKMPSGEGQPS